MACGGGRESPHCRNRVGMAIARTERGSEDRGADGRRDRADRSLVGQVVDREPELALLDDQLADDLDLGFGTGEAQIAAPAIAGRRAEFLVEPAPALDRGLRQRQLRRIAPGLPDAAQCPAGCHGREAAGLEQDHRMAGARDLVSGGCAADPASDDDDIRHRPCRLRRGRR